MTRLHIVGVRHHSPACARLVEHVLCTVRPAAVLIEGPADMNDRLDELLLGHRLPIAVFSFRRTQDDRTEASWSPLCEYSPEWVALTMGSAEGALVRFMDLPAWHEAFHGVTNRYGDHDRRRALAVEELCRRFHVDGYDALWDHLFEGPMERAQDLAALQARLGTYFHSLREGDPSSRDEQREEYMRAWIRAALANVEGPVVAVCGGYHAPVLEGLEPAASTDWPEVPSGEDARSYLVPWSYHRLDSFLGYESGMPSPAFYEEVFAAGAAAAPERALRRVVGHLRGSGQHVSAADLIAAQTLAEGLARVRGHEALRRTDLLDGLASALVKESLDAPLPWAERGVVGSGTAALLVEVLKALSGEREGSLHERTPRPPLLADVEAALAAQGLTPSAAARTVKLELAQPADLEKSRVLHRLRVLEIPGFRREAGPEWSTDPVLLELWILARHDLAESALIEAASFGATLEAAAARRLEEALLADTLDLAQTTALLGEAVFIGIESLTTRAVSEVRRHAAAETDLSRLGTALSRLLGVWSHDALFGARGRPSLSEAIRETYARGVWLLENLSGTAPSGDGKPVAAVSALRDCARLAAQLGLEAEEACAVFARLTAYADAPPDVRGACLGALWSLGRLGDSEASSEAAVRAVRQAALPSVIGDFLAGLFALAREETVRGEAVLRAVDEVVGGISEAEFLGAVPALRLAYGYFPPREKAAIAERVAALHGQAGRGSRLLALEASAEDVTRGRALDAEVEAAMRRWALLPMERVT